MKKDLSHYADLAAKCIKPKSIACDLSLTVDGETFQAYEVSIAHCDLLFFCDKGTANYLIDTYHGKVMACELFNWEKDEAV